MGDSFVLAYQIWEFRGYVSTSVFHDKQFFLKFEWSIPYAALYKIHPMSVNRMLEQFVTCKIQKV